MIAKIMMIKESQSKTDIDCIRSRNKYSTCNTIDIQNGFNLFELPILVKKMEINLCQVFEYIYSW